MDSMFDRLARSIEEERLVGVATVTSGPATGGKVLIDPQGPTQGDLGLPEAMAAAALARCRELLTARQTTSFVLGSAADETEIFFETYEPPPRLIVVGAVHVAIPLVAIA